MRIVQECTISIAAEWAYEQEQNAEVKKEQEEAKRKAERQRRGMR